MSSRDPRSDAKTPRGPGIVGGAAVGALLGAPLIAISYLAWRYVRLPFAAFDVFDWTTRVLPGPLVTFGIEGVVSVVRGARLGATSETAKTVEQAMAVAGVLAACGSAGALLFAWLRRSRSRRPHVAGAITGAVLGVPAAVISVSVNRAPTGGPIVGSLWILATFVAWGVVLGWSRRRVGRPPVAEVAGIDRRRFLLTLGGASAVITVAGAYVGSLRAERRPSEGGAGGRWSASHPLPNAGAEVSPAPGTRPEFTPLEQHYRIDINTRPLEIDEKAWRLRVHGLVDAPLAIALDDLRSQHEPLHQFVTIACISNPVAGDLIGTTRWTGVSLKHLLAGWGLKPSATHLKIRSADGFFEVVPLATVMADERVMLAYAWDGVPLTAGHGFPLRIYIPNVYGMKQPKWIESIEATDHWEPGYWVDRGWDHEARMKATAVVDTVAIEALERSGGQTLVPIGGIAHAGARGVSKVEVRVDDGDWQPARLRTPLSGLTWVVWRFDWPFQPGRHTFAVRCHDGGGVAQISDDAPPHPAGASGIHSRSATLPASLTAAARPDRGTAQAPRH